MWANVCEEYSRLARGRRDSHSDDHRNMMDMGGGDRSEIKCTPFDYS